MRAIAIRPGVKGSARLIDAPTPDVSAGDVRVQVIRLGIDGTDVELDRGEYGEAPAGESELIIGHESLGRVERVEAGVSGFEVGDIVVALVRRPDDCGPCSRGEPDLCIKGQYTERGIKGQHGFLADFYVERPEFLVKLSPRLQEVGVLLEPVSVVEKALRHAWAMQGRMRAWEPSKALVLGAGPIGLLAAMLLRLRGLETVVYARTPSEVTAARLQELGARYVAKEDPSGTVAVHLGALPERFGPFDFVLEATGAASVVMGAMRIIGPNGVLALASVTGGEAPMEICPACLNLDLVLGNKVVFGTVNANRVDFEAGVRHLEEALARWPGWLEGLITRRVPLERFREAFRREPNDVKVVIEL